MIDAGVHGSISGGSAGNGAMHLVAPHPARLVYDYVMLEDLDHLAARLKQLVEFTHALRAENNSLAHRLALTEAENQRLRAMLEAARERVDDVLARIPDPDALRAHTEPEQSANGTV